MASLASAGRAAAGRLSLSVNIGRQWSKPETQPQKPVPVGNVSLNAVIPTWCETDIIAAAVANAFAQGCDRVFVVDNDSPDDTTAEAKQAGAEIARVYHTEFSDDVRKMSEIGDVVRNVSSESGAEHVWWLLCDADEFAHGPNGLTIAEYVSRLDRRFRVVGARVFNHFPSSEPAYVRGRHPLDLQPLCQEVRIAWCSLRHWKHPLIRWDRDGVPISPRGGFHRVDSAIRVIEPSPGVFVHHFQYREREFTMERLRRLCEDRADQRPRSALQESRQAQNFGARWRYASLDDVYANRWAQVPRPALNGYTWGVQPRHWNE